MAKLESLVARLEAARLGTFVVGSVLLLLRADLSVSPVIPTIVGSVALAAFVALVVRHRRLRRRLRRERAAFTLARVGLRRVARDWPALHGALEEFGYEDPLLEPQAASDESHPYLADLDLFGPASVRALLGLTPSATGSETLRDWLSAPAPAAEVHRRQAAVRVLADDPDGRDTLAIEGLLIDRVGTSAWRTFKVWLDSPSVFPDQVPGWSRKVAWALPAVTLGLLVAWSFNLVPAGAWLATLVLQTILALRWGGALGEYFDAAGARSPGLRRHHPLFAAWESYEPRGSALDDFRAPLLPTAGLRASEEIRSLERWLDAASSHGSMMHHVYSIALLWDVHLASGLERWRARAGAAVPAWFEALGQLEALSALATLAHDQPEWSFPDIHDGDPGFAAEALGHPLLSDTTRRPSDVTLDGPGGFLLVTGSNMSGKSTLLRSIGLAAVLGQAGSVVCARRLEMTPLRTFTSMRIHDSLTEGVSHFMAELLRLKALVDAANARGADQDGFEAYDAPPALLYLIDEVLQGTNSEERRVAARRIISHLLDSHAIGAVTTHDLALHEEPRLDDSSRKVHFRETVEEEGDQVLSFDYVLRPGLATSRNALKLLRIVGLDSEP
ncbi:MAG: hypothetical protein HKN72_08760 [Gemmatimonadetes bacterium]|nr:hypothetical protein [Gemmatimonadota bacterium]